MGQSYQQITARLAIDGIRKVWPPRVCQRCNTSNTHMSKLHNLKVCFHCKLTEEVERKRQPKLVRALVLAGLLLLCGCQSPPRKANIECNVMGQQLKVSVMR